MPRLIARIVHPAPVVRESTDGLGIAWVRCETPCEIPEIDARRAPVVQRFHYHGTAEVPGEILAVEGGLWRRLDGRMPNIGRDPYPGPDDLVAYLEDRLPLGLARGGLQGALEGTPVDALDGRRGGRGEGRIAVRGALHDGRVEAEAALRAYVAGSLAVSGNRVLVRTNGLHLVRAPWVVPGRGSPWSFGVGPERHDELERRYRPDRVAEALAFEAGLGNDGEAIPSEVLGGFWVDPATDPGNGDIVDAANAMVRFVGWLARDRFLGRLRAEDRRDMLAEDNGLRARMSTLAPWYHRAARGLVGPDDALEAVEACEGLAGAIEAAFWMRGPDATAEFRAAARLFREGMLPRLAATGHGGEPSGEDVESLLALR